MRRLVRGVRFVYGKRRLVSTTVWEGKIPARVHTFSLTFPHIDALPVPSRALRVWEVFGTVLPDLRYVADYSRHGGRWWWVVR
jgi:hypothetical protein